MLFGIDIEAQMIILRFVIYLLLPSLITACILLYRTKEASKSEIVAFIAIALFNAFILMAISGFVSGPLSLIGELIFSGRDKLAVILISVVVTIVLIALYVYRSYFITNPGQAANLSKSKAVGGGADEKTDGNSSGNLRYDYIGGQRDNQKDIDLTSYSVDLEKALFQSFIEEGQASRRYKFLVLNIYLLVNAAFILFYFFLPENISLRLLAATSAIYVSLSMFMLYVFRISNARLTTLLSIQEDLHKKNRIDEYLKRINRDEEPTDNDIEIIRLLFINRAERERPTNHPYEILMKGISNSNIQLKGGKLEATAGSDKTSSK